MENKNLFVYFSRWEEYTLAFMLELISMAVRLSCENKELKLYFICDDFKAAMDKIEKLYEKLKSLTLSSLEKEETKNCLRELEDYLFTFKYKNDKQPALEQGNNLNEKIARKNNTLLCITKLVVK